MNDAVKPPLTTTTSILPAMVVLAIAVTTLAGFLIINLVANPRVRPSATTVPIVVGGLAPDPASHVLSGCHQAGNPPNDILPALVVPVGTTGASPVRHPNGGAGDYDCLRTLRTSTSAGRLLGFYSAHLHVLGWDLFSRGTGAGADQILFQRAGSDTFYWVVGVTIDAHGAHDVTWTYRIYQNSSAI